MVGIQKQQDDGWDTKPRYIPGVCIGNWVEERRKGIGKEHLYGHHGNKYSNNAITWYDENFNKRERIGNNKLPELREWKISARMAWVPEKTDYPIYGKPTNWGLFEQKKQDWNDELAEKLKSVYLTTHQDKFGEWPQMEKPSSQFQRKIIKQDYGFSKYPDPHSKRLTNVSC